jgi:hypothetical protein
MARREDAEQFHCFKLEQRNAEVGLFAKPSNKYDKTVTRRTL